jgi:4-hydroxy-3-polyprenylbenzoate decarboxylase
VTSYLDLREWLSRCVERNIVEFVDGADPVLEIGALTEHMYHTVRKPVLVFNNILGYKPGYRLMTNVLASPQTIGVTFGLDVTETGTKELIKYIGEQLKCLRNIPPEYVNNGPVLENIMHEEEVDLLELPAPLWHPLDGGRYLGTGSITITKDPEEGWVNLGTYRIMIVDQNSVSFYVSPGKHAKLQRDKYFKKGKPCPVAISLGHDPLLFMLGSFECPYGQSEYDIAGGFKGHPIEVLEGRITGLPIPARSEVVLEGEALATERCKEGPFGEWTGYYGSGEREEIVIRIKAVYHRNDPIILGAPPYKPPSPNSYYLAVLRSAKMFNDLTALGVSGIEGIWFPVEGGSRFLAVISVKQSYPGHAKQVAMLVASAPSSAYMGRYVIIVDDDIDPTNINDVLWAMSTRTDPVESIDFIRRCWSSPLDPMVAINQENIISTSRAIIDACRPYEKREQFPDVLKYDENVELKIKKKWPDLFDRK